MLQRNDLQQFGALGHQRPVTLLGPRGPARKNPVLEAQKLLLENPPSEIGSPDRRSEELLQIGFGNAVEFRVAHGLDGDLRRGVADISPGRKERFALAHEPYRNIHAIVAVVSQPDAAAHDIEIGVAFALTNHAFALAEYITLHFAHEPLTVLRGKVVFPAEFFDKCLHALQV